MDNSARQDALASADPGTDDGGGRGLAAEIRAAVTDPDDPADVARVQGLAAQAALPSRSTLYHEVGFWAAQFWSGASLDAQAARATVDPLQIWDVWIPAVPSAEGRAALAASWARQVPADVPRLLLDARRRSALLDALGGMGSLRVRHALVQPGVPVDDPYQLLEEAVLLRNPTLLRTAWSEASVDSAIVVRLARDVALRARIHALDDALGDQIEWELHRDLQGEIAQDEEGILEVCLRPALQALAPLAGVAPWWADTHAIAGAVRAFLDDYEIRLLQSELVEPDGFTPAHAEHARAVLRQRFRDYYGKDLLAVAAGPSLQDTHDLLDALGGQAKGASAPGSDASSSDGSSGETGDQTEDDLLAVPSWEDVAKPIARRRATALASVGGDLLGETLDAFGFAPDRGNEVLRLLEAARAEFRNAASGENTAVAQVEERARQGLRWVGSAYEDQFGALDGLFRKILDPGKRLRAGQLLGTEPDAAGDAATAALLAGRRLSKRDEMGRAGEERTEVDQERFDRERKRRVVELSAQAEQTGRDLAGAVLQHDAGEAMTIAARFKEAFNPLMVAGMLTAGELPGILGVVEAAYSPSGGDLRHGVATLQNSDDVFALLGFKSNGAALRKKGDTRTDEVLEAEYRLRKDIAELFVQITNGDGDRVLEVLENVDLDATAYLDASGPDL